MVADNIESKKRLNLKKILFISIIIIFLLILTGTIAYFIAIKASQPETKTKIEDSKGKYTYPGGEYLTNLADKGYIKLTIEFELENKEMIKELDKRKAEIRDRVNFVLRSKTSEDIKGDTGMEKLRDSIKKELNLLLKQGRVLDVYFTNIIVQ